MTKFLKLTSIIINTTRINNILVNTNPNNYHISMNNIVNGFFIFGTGPIWTENDKFIVFEKENPKDYKITEWINNDFTSLNIQNEQMR